MFPFRIFFAILNRINIFRIGIQLSIKNFSYIIKTRTEYYNPDSGIFLLKHMFIIGTKVLIINKRVFIRTKVITYNKMIFFLAKVTTLSKIDFFEQKRQLSTEWYLISLSIKVLCPSLVTPKLEY